MITEEAVIATGTTLLYHKNSQKFPVCNSLLAGDEQAVLFDLGCGHSDYFESIVSDGKTHPDWIKISSPALKML